MEQIKMNPTKKELSEALKRLRDAPPVFYSHDSFISQEESERSKIRDKELERELGLDKEIDDNIS